MFKSIFECRNRRDKIIKNIPKTFEESLEKDMKSLEKDWEQVFKDLSWNLRVEKRNDNND